MRMRVGLAAVVAVVFGWVASAAWAVTPGWECVPTTAGGAVVSGGTGAKPSCGPGTTSVLAPTFVSPGVDGKPTVEFSAVNVQVVSGSPAGEAAINGEGNLVVGYAQNPDGFAQTGSNDLIVGNGNGWSSYGEVVGGAGNQASGPYATALGGEFNQASGQKAIALGGQFNQATDPYASLIGGCDNQAGDIELNPSTCSSSGLETVAGGYQDTAAGLRSFAAGGYQNNAIGFQSAVLGGSDNQASFPPGGNPTSGPANMTSVGGSFNSAQGANNSVLGGFGNVAEDPFASIVGGCGNLAGGPTPVLSCPGSGTETVAGGYQDAASGLRSFAAGGNQNIASGFQSSVLGGFGNHATFPAGGSGTSGNANMTTVGGNSNTARGDTSSVLGGLSNIAAGKESAILGGHSNMTTGTCQTIPIAPNDGC